MPTPANYGDSDGEQIEETVKTYFDYLAGCDTENDEFEEERLSDISDNEEGEADMGSDLSETEDVESGGGWDRFLDLRPEDEQETRGEALLQLDCFLFF